MRYMDFRNRVG